MSLVSIFSLQIHSAYRTSEEQVDNGAGLPNTGSEKPLKNVNRF